MRVRDESWEARICMRVFSTFVARSNVKREQELYESWWELRSESLHESFLNSHAPVKREQELHESWWEFRRKNLHPVNSHATELRKLICKLSLLNSHKLFVVYANSRVDTSWAKKRQYGNSYAHKHRQTGASFIMTNYLRSSFNYCELAWVHSAWVVYLDKWSICLHAFLHISFSYFIIYTMMRRVEKREFAFSTLMPRSNENKSCIELHESWEARICMRVFSTLMPRSNENKSCMRVDESWEVRVCMRVFSTLVPRSNENKRCIELHESWLDITARVAKTALINSRQNLNQFKLMRVDERPCLLVSCS
jgi:hypothetical protein